MFLLALIMYQLYPIFIHIAVFYLFEGMPHLWCAIDKEGS